MCGLVGVLTPPGSTVDPEVLRRMADSLAHRGPDDAGEFLGDGVGMAHKRLAIIDLATGHQPMHRGPLTIVFNGEIYNYRELRAELEALGHRFQTASDTEVILALYQQYGEAAPVRLNGMFAFLIHDPGRRRLFAARDHLGIKPLYWHQRAGLVAWASEIKALLRHPGIEPRTDLRALGDYLTFQFPLGDATLFEGIRSVLPGTFQVADLDTLAVRATRYWEPRYAIDRDHTREYFVGRVRELVEDAVRLQVRSDVPVGSHLSGGMDSAVITMLASRHLGGRLASFTGAFREGPEFDESGFAREVAAAAGADHHLVHPEAGELPELLPRLVELLDYPVAGPGVFPQYAVSRLAARHVKVVLGGQGGDEVFGGYARYLVAYLEQVLKGAIFETNDEAEHIVSFASILPNLPSLRQYAPMLARFWETGLFEPMNRRYYRLVDRGGGEAGLLSEEFLRHPGHAGRFERFSAIFDHPDTLSYFNKMTHFDLVASLPALLQVEDRVSMGCSLESRVPLLDVRLVDLLTSIPPRMKFRGGELKHIFREACGPLVPRRILDRKDKMGFPVPLDHWADGPLREFVADTLGSRACRERGVFAPSAIDRLLQPGAESRFGRRLWGALNVELWHRRFIDGGPGREGG